MNKKQIIIGLVALALIGMIAGLGWAISKKSLQKGTKKTQTEVQPTTTQTEITTPEKIKGTPEVNKIAREIIEDYERKMATLLETYREKNKLIREKKEPLLKELNEMYKPGNVYDEIKGKRLNEEIGKFDKEEYQLQLWKEEQERLLKEEKERREKELAEKYLEKYVSEEILFVPWGEGEGKIGLREVEGMSQGFPTGSIDRYGASKLEIDKESNLYIWDDVAYPPSWPGEKIIKKPKSNKILKYVYVKEKKNGNEIGKYKYVESIPLTLKGFTINGMPFKVEKEPSNFNFRYEIYRPEVKGNMGFKIKTIDNNTGKIIKEVDCAGLRDEGDITMIGNDINGNTYVLLDNTAWKGGSILEVYKYSKEGNLLAKIKPPISEIGTETWYGQRNRIVIDKDGNIYQLVAKKDGVHIFKWEVVK